MTNSTVRSESFAVMVHIPTIINFIHDVVLFAFYVGAAAGLIKLGVVMSGWVTAV
jgi:hypothetical protein